MTGIEDNAFYGCPSLTHITIPNSVTSIGDHAFGCQLKSLTIGFGVKSIGYQAFMYGGIEIIIWLPDTPPSGYDRLAGTVNYVPNESYTGLSRMMVYNNLKLVFDVGGVKYVPVDLSERTCDAIDCMYDESVEYIRLIRHFE